MALPLLALLLLLLASGTLGSQFPQAFSVSLGSTLPGVDGVETTTTVGKIYFDLEQQSMRVDSFAGESTSMFLARYDEGRVWIMMDGRCTVHEVNGTLLPYSVPKGSILHADPVLVRDVIARHFEGMVHHPDEGLQHVDFFVHEVDGPTPESAAFYIPWRTVYYTGGSKPELVWPFDSHSKDSEDTEPDDDDNSRDVDRPPTFSSSVVRGRPGVANSRVFADYFNFVPRSQDPHVFLAPEIACSLSDVEHFAQQPFHEQLVYAQRYLIDMTKKQQDGKCEAKVNKCNAGSAEKLPCGKP